MKSTLIGTAAVTLVAAPVLAAGPLTTPEELNAMLGDADIAIIDVRSGIEVDKSLEEPPADRDYSKGHIPGAVFADYTKTGWRAERGQIKSQLPDAKAIEATIRALGVDNDDTVVIVHGGASPKALDIGAATRVYWTFKALGHDDVTILDGGYDAWVAAGLPVETEAVIPETGDFTAKVQGDMIVDGAMVELAIGNEIELLDSRPRSQFLGQAQSSWAKNPGTLETAINVGAPTLLGEAGMGFGDLAALEAAFAKAGLDKGETAYAFCNTGHHASVTWFVASELLGHDVELYDGSMYDWTWVRDGRTVLGTLPEDES